jgi:pyruvate/2-oxoacid:ferredoxin oxidoreductase beta subunit
MTNGPYCLFVVMTHAGSSSLTVRTAPGWFTAEHGRQLEAAINRACSLA